MFLLGIGSLIQCILLPGFIALRMLKIKTSGPIQPLIYAMGLSLYFNYIAACLLTWLGIYTRPVVLALFSTELILLIKLYWHDIRRVRSLPTVSDLHKRFGQYVSALSPFHKTLFLGACLTLLFFISFIPFSAGTAYYFSDALMHWTRWPAAWALNTFPEGTRHYPQLFPANLSLILIFTGEPALLFFPKLLMPAFFLGILLMFFDLSLHKRSILYLAGFFIYAAFLLIFYPILLILELNADIPVAFFAFLTYYTVLRHDDRTNSAGTVILATVFAVSAVNTKLAGTYILIPAGVWIGHYFLTHSRTVRRTDLMRTLAAVLAVGASGFVWYAVRPAGMIEGLDQSGYLKPDYFVRLSGAAAMLYYTAGAPFILFLAVTLAASVFIRDGRILAGVMVLPATILWAFFFSADYRNLSFVIPYASLVSAFGLKVLYTAIGPIDNPSSSSGVHLRRRRSIAVVKIAIPVLIIFITGTDAFFNLCMDSAYALNAAVFNHYRVGYTTEIGYYKSIEYYCSGLRLASILVLVFMTARYLRANAALLFLTLCGAGIAAGSVFLSKQFLFQRQADDENMTAVRNCYYSMRPYVRAHKPALIISDNESFTRLIPPDGTRFVYRNSPLSASTPEARDSDITVFYLIEKKMVSGRWRETALPDMEKYKVCFDNEKFIFVRYDDR